jgi:GrpB-like predicted nucleotidyltransferase (UPF0157 family)
LGEIASSIEHIGSTAVPGLPSKPIIDIDVVVEAPELVHAAILSLEGIGYLHRGDLGIAGREAFKTPAGHYHHHLYVCVKDSPALMNHLHFRDILRADKNARGEYERVKHKAAEQFQFDRVAYNEAKTNFVKGTLAKASKAVFSTK